MTTSIRDHWPLFGLRITTASLEMRTPTDADLAALVELVRDGIHDPATMPFTNEWTDEASPDRERNSLRYWWHCRSSFSPGAWDLPFAVARDGEVLGGQNLLANDFPRRSEPVGDGRRRRVHEANHLQRSVRLGP